MKWQPTPEYFQYSVIVDGVLVENHLSLAKAKKVAKGYLPDLFQPYKAEIIIYNQYNGKYFYLQNGN